MLNNKKFLLSGFAFFGFLIFYSIKLFDLINIQHALLIRSLLVIIEIFLLFKISHKFIVKEYGLKESYRSLLFIFNVFLCVFLILEFIFMFISQSHAFHGTLASRVWSAYYWKPVNKLGYRDKEIQAHGVKRNILVIGDSFTAGDGLKKYEERFSNILERRLSGFNVFNLGMDGADTRIEYKNLIGYPVKPDILILQYTGNDINCPYSHSAIAVYSDTNIIVRYFVKFTFLFNYIYWRFPHLDYQNYCNALARCYRNGNVFNEHVSDLEKFVVYCNQRKIPFIVVLFPFLTDIDFSKVYTGRIKDAFSERGVKVLDVTNLVKQIPVKERIVNINDPHPSPLVNRIVADELYSIIIKL